MSDHKTVWRVESASGVADHLREVVRYRRIALYLAWRDIIVRFKQTVVGVIWVVARPLLVALALAFVFGRVASLPSENVPYLLFVLVALLPWQFFATAVTQGSESIVLNSAIITKIYFPRTLLPASVIIGNLFDFAIMMIVLVIAFIWYGFAPSLGTLVWAPIYLATITVLAFGVATLLATLNALFRDVRHFVPFLVQFGLFLSPIGYGLSSVPGHVLDIYCLNPLVAPLEGLRVVLLGTPNLIPSWALLWSIAVSIAFAIIGIVALLSADRRLADVI